MRFLPDSAVLGFAKRLKHAGKPRRRRSSRYVFERKDKGYDMLDHRTFEQLLAEAKRHAEKAGK